MRAVVIAGFGGVDVLELRDVPEPIATADRIRVRVHATALNRADLLQRRGFYPAPAGAPADIPGLEFAGTIDQLGDDVHGWKPGQRVFGITAGGAYADHVVVPQSHVAEIPSNVSFVEAAAIPEAFITAHDALFTQARFTTGESVLIHACGSGVGTAAAQLARAGGAGAVYGTARTETKIARTRDYGLDDGIVVGSDPSMIAETIKQWTASRGVDVILDLVGASYLAANLDSLAMHGRMILIGTLGGSAATLDYRKMMGNRLSLTGTVLRSRTTEEKAYAVRAFAHSVKPLLQRGEVRAVVDSVFHIGNVREAHLRLESNESFGKVVLTMD